MKKSKLNKTIAFMAILMLGVSTLSAATAISINTTDGGPGDLFKTSTAGAVAVNNWENIAKGYTAKGGKSGDLTVLTNLRDNTNTATGVAYTATGTWGGSWSTGDRSAFGNDDSLMLVNWSDVNNASFTLTNLNGFASTYDVYVYCWDHGNNRTGGITANGQTFYITTGANAGPHAQSSAADVTTSWSEKGTKSYVKFTGVTLDTLVVSIVGDNSQGGSSWLPINGIQIVQTAAPVTQEIENYDSVNLANGGKTNNPTYADWAAVQAVLPAKLKVNSLDAAAVTWADTDTYNAAIPGTYTFTGTVGTLEDGYVDAVDTISTVTTTVTLIVEAPTVTVDSLTETSFTLTWDTVTGADSYDVVVSTNSDLTVIDDQVLTTNISSPTVVSPVSGLTGGITYYYGVTTNDSSYKSAESTGSVVTPSFDPGMTDSVQYQYMIPWTTKAYYQTLGRFRVKGLQTIGADTNISADLSAISPHPWFSDYTNDIIVAKVDSTFTLELDLEDVHDGRIDAKVWIDWNHDGVFDNTTEVVHSSFTPHGSGGQNGVYSTNITVPSTAIVGSTTRMRIRACENHPSLDMNDLDAIGANTVASCGYDYALTVMEAGPIAVNDPTVTLAVTPGTDSNGSAALALDPVVSQIIRTWTATGTATGATITFNKTANGIEQIGTTENYRLLRTDQTPTTRSATLEIDPTVTYPTDVTITADSITFSGVDIVDGAEYTLGSTEIIITPVLGLEISQNGTELTWTAEDESTVASYQIVDTTSGETVATVIAGESSYSYELDEDQTVKLVVIDKSGFEQTFFPTNGDQTPVNYELVKGWNLLTPPDNSADLSDLGSEFWTWTGESYERNNAPQVGQAFWVYADKEKSVAIVATPKPVKLELQSGWNMVGSPVNSELPEDALLIYSWNDVYQSIASDGTLLQGIGYWIFSF